MSALGNLNIDVVCPDVISIKPDNHKVAVFIICFAQDVFLVSYRGGRYGKYCFCMWAAQLLIFGANVVSVKGNYEETFELSKAAIDEYGWYNRNAAINCYLMEGKKTVALEIAEQLGWEIPDYVALSVGDGCTIGGVWKGFKDLYNAGFTDKLPKLISVQSVNTCPINRAARTGEPWEPMEENTLADSISVGVPRNPDKAINAILESGGIPVEVTDDEILEAMRVTGRECGVFGEPAGVTGMAGLTKLCREGKIHADASVVAIVTGNGLKDTANGIKAAGEPVKLEPDIDKFRAYYESLNK